MLLTSPAPPVRWPARCSRVGTVLGAIGPTTAAAAAAAGLDIAFTATDPTEAAWSAGSHGLAAERHRQKAVNRCPTPPSMRCTRRRPRRLRGTPALRRLVAETRLHPADLVLPMFVKESLTEPAPLGSMPGVLQHTRDSLESGGGARRSRPASAG